MATLTISLPNQIAKSVDLETKKHGFATRSEFIRSLLRKYFSETKKLEFLPFEKKPLEQIRTDFEKTGKYNKKFIDSLIKGLAASSLYENKASK